MRNEELYQLLESLIAHPIETQWIEFKMGAGSITNEQIGEYISAMSNGATISIQAFGYLVWGVHDDNHEVKGTNFCFTTAKQGNQDLELWIRNLLHPKVNFEIFEFSYHGKDVVMLRIPSAKGEPTNFKKKPFIRININIKIRIGTIFTPYLTAFFISSVSLDFSSLLLLSFLKCFAKT